MTTLKLSKKPLSADTNDVRATKAPVRRADPTKRDRTKAPAKPAREDMASVNLSAPRQEAGAKNNESAQGKPSQRNHRFDGKPRDANATEVIAKPHKPAGIDTRTTPRANRDEPQYRQAPRRGGKVRDGYDANAPTYGAAAKAAYKSTSVSDDLPRLSKVMAERGICSRREADEWISNGWVKVDGDIIETLGTRIRPDAEIIISSYAQETQAENVTIILHKPVGYVSGQAEDDYQPAIVLVHPDNQWQDDPLLHKHQPKVFEHRFLRGLAPAGRLDIDSTGMLVLTQDGRIARHLIGEDSNVEKNIWCAWKVI